MTDEYFDLESFVVQYEYSEQDAVEYNDEQIDNLTEGVVDE